MTRKKIKEPQYEPDNGPLTSKQVEQLQATTKKSRTKKEVEVWPKVVVGSHLTVTTYENGKTELKWDDEALARDIREALSDYDKKLQEGLKLIKSHIESKPKNRIRKIKGQS